MSQLSAQNVSKEYLGRSGPLAVLREISLELAAGENLAIVGPSGSGKTTLLNILGTLELPTTGRILLDGQDPAGLDEPALAEFRRQNIGFVFQEHHLLPQCSVLENVLLPAVAVGSPTPEIVYRARTLLDRVGLSNRLDHRPAELSGGERQRTALARALLLKPKLLLADEPTGNLDRTTADHVAGLLLQLQAQEAMILVVVTHSERLAARLARQLELDLGRLATASTGG